MRGSEADFNPELKHQIRLVEEDEDVGGSDNLSNGTPIAHPTSDDHLPSFHGIARQFDDAELVDSWNCEIKEFHSNCSFGWCGLDAINSGLLQLGLSPISKAEAVRILSVTESGVEQDGMNVYQAVGDVAQPRRCPSLFSTFRPMMYFAFAWQSTKIR